MRHASGQGVSLSVLGAVPAAGNSRSGSMGSILSNRTDSGCVTPSDPISASRTASRFGFCQPFSDLLGPLLTLIISTNTGFSGISDLAGSAPEAENPTRNPRVYNALQRLLTFGANFLHRSLHFPRCRRCV